MNIDELQPGADIDQLIAKEIMGWTIKERRTPDSPYPRMWLGEKGYLTGWSLDEWGADAYVVGNSPAQCTWHGIFRPSVDWGAAGLVFERVFELTTKRISVEKAPGDGYQAGVAWEYVNHAPTAQLAICRAALKAVME